MRRTPYSNLNAPRNRRKAAENLWGICHGLVADKVLNADEIAFLQIWLNDNQPLLSDPDALDLYESASDIVRRGTFTVDHRADLKTLVEDILEANAPRASHEETAQTNMLLGILQGVMADDTLNDKEIRALDRWLRANKSWRENWPGDLIYRKLRAVLEDGIITQDERASLETMLHQTTNTNFKQTGSSESMTITLGTEDLDQLRFLDASFCFTGTFLYGTRKDCQAAVSRLDGINHNSIKRDTDYLVLGTRISPDWINTSFGRKIEHARALQEEGSPIKIITEECWVRHL